MNEKVLKTLEFNKIISLLSKQADSDPGRLLCEGLRPSSDIEEINISLQETDSAFMRLSLKGNISFRGLKNPVESLARLKKGGNLSAQELLIMAHILLQASQALDYEDSCSSNGKNPPDSLTQYFKGLFPLNKIRREIERCIISEDEINDDASPELSDLRKKRKRLEGKIHQTLQEIMSSRRQMLQENVVTMRDGRYCLPVKAEYRSSFSGTVLGQSNTLSTLFIEPSGISQINIEINTLLEKERTEIERILSTLSSLVFPEISHIEENISILSKLDFIFAKARLAGQLRAVKPFVNKDHYINIYSARHPLLNKDTAVPINIYIGREFRLLVITGPNTGGKTVSLKTLGLFQLMGQAGLFIPAATGSQISVFDEVFADIGDEQSIEQNLSTFSSHMTNIVRILSLADQNSLCLFDELGAGTDPTEGAALALSILNDLKNRNTLTLATTHYAEIKVYAISEEGVMNASCEFDIATLSPTYRLLIGIPGKSNAFQISKKLGLPDYIIEDARKRLEKEDIRLEDVISDLEEKRLQIEREQAEISKYRLEIEEYKKKARENSKGVEKGREKILSAAREEAQRILIEAKEESDSILRDMRAMSKDSALIDAEKKRSGLNRLLKAQQESSQKKLKGPDKPVSARKLKIGDSVRVASLDLTATVSTLPDKDNFLYVTSGIIRTKVNTKDLEMISDPPLKKEKKHSPGHSLGMAKALSVQTEINLIGMTTAEALPELQSYLSDCLLSHIASCRIVHGRGTGALRKAVHSYLKKQKFIESFRLGEFGEGQDGVTIVSFKA